MGTKDLFVNNLIQLEKNPIILPIQIGRIHLFMGTWAENASQDGS